MVETSFAGAGPAGSAWRERGLYTARIVEMGRANPFTPGAGVAPPLLAGREPEQKVLGEFIETLRAREPPAQFVIFYGPRGNGKTALLDWAAQQVEADGEMDAVRLTPADIPTPDDLWPRLGGGSGRGGASGSGAGGGAFRSSEWQPLLAEVLRARAGRRPFAVLLDEAHTIGTEVAQQLLNAAQTASSRSPFLLVLAGNDVGARLSGLGVSFWERSALHPVGRLGPEAAAEAIRRPLADRGVKIEPEALDRIVRETDGYPYFMQLWGQVIWDRAVSLPDSGRRITGAVVEEAAREFARMRNLHFRRRCDELADADLLPAARAVALALRGREHLPFGGLCEAVRRATVAGAGPDERAAARGLRSLGLVCESESALTWEPSIPRLMDYLLEHAPAPSS